jgi:hypothetical protein
MEYHALASGFTFFLVNQLIKLYPLDKTMHCLKTEQASELSYSADVPRNVVIRSSFDVH